MATVYPYRPSLQMVRSKEGVPPLEVVQISRARENCCLKPQYQKHVLHDMIATQRENRPPTRGQTYRSTHTGMISPKRYRPRTTVAPRSKVNQDWVIHQNYLQHHPFPNRFRNPPVSTNYASWRPMTSHPTFHK